MSDDDHGSDDIENASTLPVDAGAADPSEGAERKPGQLVDEIQRRQVQQALFGESSSSFQLGRYVITGTLGRGGMGVVFKAFDPELDRRVALKVLRAELDERHTIRLRREAKAMAKLSHPNVVQVHEVGQAEGQTFVAMELVGGQTLGEWMRQQPRPTWRECVEVFVQVGAGLAAAHDRGLVHRDFKPGNAIIDEEGRPRVLDFGLARQAGEAEEEPPSLQRARTRKEPVVRLDESLTKTGAVLGTPAYMPPEQMEGREANARSDQFSFCVALWEALYGERPFEGSSMVALMISMTNGDLRPAPKGSPVPGTLRTMLIRGLAVDPEQRWSSMDALLDQLRRLLVPRRWRWVGGGLTLGLAALGTSLAAPQFVAMQERCSGARAQLDGIWDDARRRDVEGAVLGTGLSYAPGTWERIEPRLDEYADAWVGKHTEVCEATTVRHEQTEDAMTLRMSCLGERRTALRAAVKVLAAAETEPETVNNAVKLVTGLPALARCDDVERLEQQRQRMPPPEDPQLAEAVEQAREELADIRAMDKAGWYDEASKQAEPLVEQAKALGYGPLQAEARYWYGNLLDRRGHYAKAEPELKRAHALALEHAHDQVELKAAQGLTFLMGHRLAEGDEGLTWGETALALAKRSDDEVELAGSLNNLGGVLNDRGEYEQAKLHHQQALRIEERILGPEHPHLAASLNNLGVVFKRLGNYEKARDHYQRALSVWTKSLGPEHPYVAYALGSLGTVFRRLGEYEQAKLHHEKALAIRERALAPDHPDIANSLNNLANVLKRLGEYEQARHYCQRAIPILEKALGPDHPHVATSRGNLANVLKNLGEYEQAEAQYQRSLEIREKTLGSDHPRVANSLIGLGLVANGRREYEGARLHYERALGIMENALGPDHPNLVTVLVNLGGVSLSLEEYGEAKRRYQRALQIQEKALGPEHADVADIHMGLANLALAQHDATVAREYAERAVSIREKGPIAPAVLADARFLLAQVLWSDDAETGRARQLAEQARDVYAEHGKGREHSLAEAEAWLVGHPMR